MDKQKEVLIIGAGFAGMKAAQVLAKDSRVNVTLVDKNNYHLFQPLLYQVASTGLNPSEISSTIRRTFRGKKNVKVLRAKMTDLDKSTKVATFNDGEFTLPYDYLLLCLGGKTCYFGNNHWEEVAPGLKSLQDAVDIRNRLLRSLEEAERLGPEADIEKMTSVVVIGGGPTGVELAGSFAELRSRVLRQDYREFDPDNIKVTLIEAGPSLLNGYDKKSGEYTKKRLEKLGVQVLMEEPVSDITEKGVQTKNRFLPSTNVIWAAGVEGHPLAKLVSDNLDRRGRVNVTAELLAEGETDIFVCGDMNFFAHDEKFPHGLPGVAPAAIQQGERAAKNILAELSEKPMQPFKYFDKGKMATIGRSAAVAETGSMKMRGFTAWIAWLFIHLLYLVEFQDRVMVFFRWVWSYFTWNWGVRIIFGANHTSIGSSSQTPTTVDEDVATADEPEEELEDKPETGTPESEAEESEESPSEQTAS